MTVPTHDAPFLRILEQENVPYELLLHAPTMRAVDEATALGLPGDEVGKTLVLQTPDGLLRAVVLASDRLSLHKVRDLLGAGKELRLATEEELAGAYPMFELGAVPPFAGPDGDRVLVDSAAAKHETLVVEAGVHDQSVRLRTKDIVALSRAEVADIRED